VGKTNMSKELPPEEPYKKFQEALKKLREEEEKRRAGGGVEKR